MVSSSFLDGGHQTSKADASPTQRRGGFLKMSYDLLLRRRWDHLSPPAGALLDVRVVTLWVVAIVPVRLRRRWRLDRDLRWRLDRDLRWRLDRDLRWRLD